MTDQIKPEVDDGRTLSLLARIDELKAQLAAQEQSHKDILQAAGEEAARQIADLEATIAMMAKALNLATEGLLRVRDKIAEKDKEINRYNAALRTAVSDKVLAEQALAEKNKRIAELEDSVADTTRTLLKNTVTIHDLRGRIAELEDWQVSVTIATQESDTPGIFYSDVPALVKSMRERIVELEAALSGGEK